MSEHMITIVEFFFRFFPKDQQSNAILGCIFEETLLFVFTLYKELLFWWKWLENSVHTFELPLNENYFDNSHLFVLYEYSPWHLIRNTFEIAIIDSYLMIWKFANFETCGIFWEKYTILRKITCKFLRNLVKYLTMSTDSKLVAAYQL